MKYELMFVNASARGKWETWDRSQYDVTAADLNIGEAVRYFYTKDRNFYEDYIKYPCRDRESALRRLDIIAELLENETEYGDLKRAAERIYRLKTRYYEYIADKTELLKQYRAMCLWVDWMEAAAALYEAVFFCSCSGLCEMKKQLELLCCDEELRGFYNEACELKKQFSELLELSLQIDYGQNLLKVIRTDDNKHGRAAELSHRIEEILGRKADFGFSVVDANPFSILEQFIIETRIDLHTEAFARLVHLAESFVGAENEVRDLIALLPQLSFYFGCVELVRTRSGTGEKWTAPEFGDRWDIEAAISPALLFRSLNEMQDSSEIVQNDIKMNKNDIMIITGANQGGKSTYAKCAALFAHLAMCGFFVPAERCILPWYEGIYTHFIRKETEGNGRLQQELDSLRQTLEHAEENSLILLNECFSSTRRRDGVRLALLWLEAFGKKDCTLVFVTHLYEIVEMMRERGMNTLCMCAKLDGVQNRTYKIIKSEKGSLSYAGEIAQRCGVTFEQLCNDYKAVQHDGNTSAHI